MVHSRWGEGCGRLTMTCLTSSSFFCTTANWSALAELYTSICFCSTRPNSSFIAKAIAVYARSPYATLNLMSI